MRAGWQKAISLAKLSRPTARRPSGRRPLGRENSLVASLPRLPALTGVDTCQGGMPCLGGTRPEPGQTPVHGVWDVVLVPIRLLSGISISGEEHRGTEPDDAEDCQDDHGEGIRPVW